MQLDAKMTMVERRVMAPIARICERQGDVIAEEIDARDVPFARPARDREGVPHI